MIERTLSVVSHLAFSLVAAGTLCRAPVPTKSIVPIRRIDDVYHGGDIVDGLENAPVAFVGLLKGKNFGKLVVRVA